MKKGNREGIIFDDTVYLTEENYKRFPIYMRLLQALAIFIGSYCFMTIFISSFDLQFINTYLIIAIIITEAVLFPLFLYPKHDYLKLLLVLVVYGGIAYYKFNQLKNAFYILENAIISSASNYYSFTGFTFVADYKTAAGDLTLLLIIIVIPVVEILTLSILHSIGKFICYIIMLIPIVASFAMGVTPPEVDLIAYILVFLFLSISGSFTHAKASRHTFGKIQKSMIYRIGIRSASLLCLIVLILFFVIKQFIPVETYKDYEGVYEAKTKIQSFMTDFSLNDISNKLGDVKWNITPGRIGGSGGLNLGELGRVDKISFDETEHLLVTAPLGSVDEGIYLKGYIGSEYTGNSWETHSRPIRNTYNEMMDDLGSQDFEPALGSSWILNHNARKLFINKGRIDIKHVKADRKYVYAPYFTVFDEKDGISFTYDLAAISDKKIETGAYDYSYNLSNIADRISDLDLSSLDALLRDEEEQIIDEDNIDTQLLEYHENEKIYREFVYETYTKLPKEGLDRLKRDFSRENIGPASENISDAIDYVKDYLNRFTRYTLSPGRLPKDKDFVEYFIYENKIGYCSHFASAGALMLRAMGYPSRYVEGYAISRSDLMNQPVTSYLEYESDMVEISVKDYNAHAWVEVYLDGFGWVPVEFTTGAGIEDLSDAIGDLEELGEQGSEEELRVPNNNQPIPTVAPGDEVDPSPPASSREEDIMGSSIPKDKQGKTRAGFKWYYAALFILIIITAIIIYRITFIKRNDDIGEKCYSKRALRLYKAIEHLLIYNHGLPKKSRSLEEDEEYAKKHLTLISPEDFEVCMDTVRKARFGKESINPKEYGMVEHVYKTLWDRVYEGLPWVKKVYFKLLYKPLVY